ncbi:MAG: hypothetical protein ABI137_15135 [Antricoccus sp.]
MSGPISVVLAASSGSSQAFYAIGLMALGGLLIGGGLAAKQNERLPLAIILGLLGAVAAAGGILWQFKG